MASPPWCGVHPHPYPKMPSPLLALTILIDLIGLGVTIWLGFMFLVGNPRRMWAWVAATLMWGFSFIFALVLLQLGQPLVPTLPWLPYLLLRWVLIPIPLAWFGVVTSVLPGRLRPLVSQSAPIAVGATLILLLITAIIGPFAPAFGLEPSIHEWIFYPAFMITTAACLLPPISLAWRAQNATNNPAYRESARAVGIASALALVAAIYRVGAFWITNDLSGLPALPGDIGLLAALITLGAGLVLRQIGEGETNWLAFSYALTNAIAMSVLYSLVGGLLAIFAGISWVVLVAIVPLAVTTHWLTDWLRSTFDRWFYRAPVQRLRNDLRELLRTLDYEESLANQVRPLLVRLVGQVAAPCAAVMVREEGGWHSVVSFPGEVDTPPATLPPLSKRAVLPLPAPASVMAGPAWVIPLTGEGNNDGLLVVWSGTSRSFNDVELQLLDEVGYQVTLVLEGWRSQSERLQTIEALVGTYREEAEALRKSALEGVEADPAPQTDHNDMRTWVEEAARNLHNVGFLGQHPMAGLKSITPYITLKEGQAETQLDRGQAVRKLLETLIERLRPANTAPPEPLPPEWRLYTVLHAAYIENVPNREIMSRLYIGEGTFHRARRQALDSLASTLVELEQNGTG
jgi:hypothetical protein